jgi:hypothetical protein
MYKNWEEMRQENVSWNESMKNKWTMDKKDSHIVWKRENDEFKKEEIR